MKKTKKVLILVFFMLIIYYMRLNKVLGVSSSVYTGGGPINGSNACTTNYCTDRDANFYGIKVTIKKINGSNKLDDTKKISNLNLSSTNYYLVNENYKQKSNDSIKNNSTIIQFDGLDRKLSDAANFSEYLSKSSLQANNNLRIKQILRAINTNLVTGTGNNLQFNSIYDFSGYYLEIEPVMALAFYDKINSKWYYDYGTPAEISKTIYNRPNSYFKNAKSAGGNDMTDVARSVTVVSNDPVGNGNYRCYYYSDIKNLTLKEIKRDTNPCNQIFGQWNVLRNYFTSLKINTNKIEPYTVDVQDEDKLSAIAFTQINDKSIYGKTLIRLSDYAPSCVSDFNSLGDYDNLQLRYKLYEKWFKLNNKKYNGLFDLNLRQGQGNTACKSVSCGPKENRDNSKSCLSYTSNVKNENFKNFSCFSELEGYYVNDNDYHLNYICNTNFKFTNNLGTTNFSIIPGQKIPGTDGLIATGILSKYCSFKSNGSTNSISFNPNIIKSVTFNDQDLNYKISEVSVKKPNHSEVKTTIGEPISKYTVDNFDNGNTSIDFKYEFFAPEEVYLKKGTGENVNHDENVNKYNAENGIYTEYKWRESLNGFIPFTISFNNNSSDGSTKKSNTTVGNKIYNKESRYFFPNYENELDDSKKCNYNWNKKGLFKYCNGNCDGDNNELNLEFRIINLEKPFINKYGKVRNTMTNWCYQFGIEDVTKIQRIAAGEDHVYSNYEKYDLNKDGKIDTDDAILIQEVISDGVANCSFNNSVVKEKIKDAPDSYGKSKDGHVDPKYKIILTSQLMKDISDYAKEKKITYDSFNLECRDRTLDECKDSTLDENKIYQTSQLLTYLKDKKEVLTINNSTKRK